MKLKQFSGWFLLAGALLAFILLVQPHLRRRAQAARRILPGFDAAAVTAVQVVTVGKPEVRAEHTNSSWVLVQPVRYPARSVAINQLLAFLQTLTPAAYIPHPDLSSTNAVLGFGFGSPQATLWIWQGDYRLHLFIGSRTPPGDQVYFQVAGDDGIYVVDAALLRFLPMNAADWRKREIFHLQSAAVDQIAVTNGGKAFELRRPSTSGLWQIVTPGAHVRGDNERISSLVSNLQALTITDFISDSTNADLDTYGLASPGFQLFVAQGTNSAGGLLVGKAVTNDDSQCYARLPEHTAIFTVARAAVDPWRKANELRDTHLLSVPAPVARMHVHAEDDFTLVNTNGGWVVEVASAPPRAGGQVSLPGTNAGTGGGVSAATKTDGVQGLPALPINGFPADPALVSDLLSNLTGMEIVQFVKDVVTAPDLPAYGLAAPVAQYELQFSPTQGPGPTNLVVAFGTNQDDKVFVRRTDESAVYAVNGEQAKALPTASWQLRERRVWDFSEEEVTGVKIVQHGQQRELVRKREYEWGLAPGSSGSIQPLAIEETVRPLCHLNAAFWVACGETNRTRFGLTNGDYQITLKTKEGKTFPIEFGAVAPSSFPYAGVKLDGELWIFELPLRLSRDVLMYLSVASP